MNHIKVTVNGKEKEYLYGTRILEIAKDFQKEYDDDILLAVCDHTKLRELHHKVKKDCQMDFITYRQKSGCETYRRSATLLMLKAFYSVWGKKIQKITVDFTIGKGFYCRVAAKEKLTDEIVAKVKEKMLEMVEKDLPISKRSLETDAAIALFHEHGMFEKEKLFRFRRVSKANLYTLDGFEDYYYGYMVPSAGYIKYFDLLPYEEGVLLQMPARENPKQLQELPKSEKLFHVLMESTKWSEMLNVETVGTLNEAITKGEINNVMLVQEALQEKKIADIAEKISLEKDKRFIMIAGPSSSGKTTFSHRLSVQLLAHGLKPHPIPVDNYFLDREKSPVDENGNYNYEVLEALDVEQFNKDMIALSEGKRVELPTYNFIAGKREYKGNFMQLGPDDILVIEGIHCLNDKLSYALPKNQKFKIYISALTQLNIDEHNRIPTTDGRLIRRMVRDARTRGASARDTIRMWPSVRKGEEQYIFPFQEDADVMFNSALIYELSVLKQFAEPLLFGIPTDCPEYIEAKRLLKFLNYFLGVDTTDIPKNSLLREFVGGGCFKL